jgi:PEP-CTERM motif
MRTTTKVLLFSCAALALSLLATRANATTILYAADFNNAGNHSGNYTSSADYLNGTLAGQDGWVAHSATGSTAQTVSNNPTDGHVVLGLSGEDTHASFVPSANPSAWLSADVTISAASTTGDYFLHLGDGGASAFNDRVYAKSTTGGFLFGIATTSSSLTYGTVPLAFGTYHIVAEYDMVAGAANDTAEIFVNPVDPLQALGETPYATNTATTGTEAAVLSAVYLRQGGATTSAAATVDNIAVVPEPSAIILSGLGIAGLVVGKRLRRRTAT